MDFFNVLTCVGGIALFLFGMTYMSEALKKCAGNQMKNFLMKMTSSPTRGFLVGLLVTMVIQSSTATNVMAVSFVNTGMMALGQAIPLMIGSNLGTTVTAWLISLTSIDGASFFIQLLKPASFTPILAFIGIILYRFQSKERKKDIGAILLGFAILMFGMTTMSGSMSGLSEVPEFMQLFDMLTNPFLGFLVGLALAAIMQSSSASVGVLQALAVTGGITHESVIPLLIGINIGQVVPVMLSSMGTSRDARRTAIVDLFINLIGGIIALPVFCVVQATGSLPILETVATPVTIAICHSGYKLCIALILLPGHNLLEKFVCAITKGDEKEAAPASLLDKRLMATPSLALAAAKQRVLEAINTTGQALTSTVTLLDEWAPAIAEDVHKAEEKVDWYEDEIEAYLAKLSTRSMTAAESQELSNQLHIISDYENISDHIYSMAVNFRRFWENNHSFSDIAKEELRDLFATTAKLLDYADESFRTENPKLAFRMIAMKREISKKCDACREGHLSRLKEGNCSVQEGSVFTDLLLNFERIADHLAKQARMTLTQVYQSKRSAAKGLLNVLLDDATINEEALNNLLRR